MLISMLDNIVQSLGSTESTAASECRLEDVLTIFKFVLHTKPKLLEGAVDVLDEASIVEYTNPAGVRRIWRVSNAKEKEYLVAMNIPW
jgi:hypothetical protein